MKNKAFQISHLILITFSFGLACFWAAFPPLPMGDLIFGFTKIPLIVFIILVSSGLIGFSLTFIQKYKQISKFHYWVEYFSTRDIKYIFFALFTSVIFFSWIIFIPNAQLDPSISEYHKRLLPLFIWMFFMSNMFFFNTVLVIRELNKKETYKKFDSKIIITSIIILLSCVSISVLIWYTKQGIIPIRHWEKNGVPVLFRQVVVLVWGVAGWLLILKPAILKSGKKSHGAWGFISKYIDTIVFFLIWIIAGAFWISEPLPFNMFNPGSTPPDYVHYPSSDALYAYDLSAQKALIGVEEQSLSKPAYSGFLFILHLLTSQNYELLLALQTAIFAILPAVAYLIGKKLYNRTLGMAISFLIIVQTWNSIKGNLWIWKVAHPKMEMSDFPAAVIISIFAYFFISWYQQKEEGRLYLICSGASLGLSFLVRDNAWLLLPLPLLFIFIKKHKSKKMPANLILFILGLTLIISPWMIQNYKILGAPIYFLDKVKYVIIDDRYRLDSNEDQEKDKEEEKNPNTTYHEKDKTEELIPDESVPNNNEYEELIYQSSPKRITERIIGHYLHGLVAIAFTTPPTINFDNLFFTITVSSETKSIWGFPWEGTLPIKAYITLLLNLAIFSIGLSGLWNQKKYIGVFPLGIILLYLLADAFAFTSGGRYITPINWCYYIYYGMGLIIIIQKTSIILFPNTIDSALLKQHQHNSNKRKTTINLASLSIIFFLGVIPAVMGYFSPKQFHDTKKWDTIDFLENTNFFETSDTNKAALINFSKNKKSFIQHGRILYPRYLDRQNNEFAKNLYIDIPIEEPFIVFTLLNSKSKDADIYMPLASIPDNFSHGIEVVVIGCKEGQDVRAFNIFVIQENDLWVSESEKCFLGK